MAVEEQAETRTEYSRDELVAGGVGGLVGGIVMGVMLQMLMTPVLVKAIPALYGASGLAIGWLAHLFHSVVFGLVFAAAVSIPSVSAYADDWLGSAGVGLVYGIVLWVVAAAIVMPIWLSAVGFPAAPSLPNFNPMSLVGHVVYGVVLGAVYVPVRDR